MHYTIEISISQAVIRRSKSIIFPLGADNFYLFYNFFLRAGNVFQAILFDFISFVVSKTQTSLLTPSNNTDLNKIQI